MPDLRAFMGSGYATTARSTWPAATPPATSARPSTHLGVRPDRRHLHDEGADARTHWAARGSAIINDHLFVAGGRDANNAILDSLYDYDIATNTWSTGANLPRPTTCLVAGVGNGMLYIFGGGNPFAPGKALGKTAEPAHA